MFRFALHCASHLIWLLAALCWLPRGVWAEVAPAYADRPIVAVEAVGESATMVLPAELELPPGSRVDRATLRTFTKRLLSSGRWGDVQIDASAAEGGVRLLVHLRPRLSVSRIEVRGHEVLPEADILEGLGMVAGASTSEAELPKLVAQVRRTYHARGYLDVVVSARLRATPDPARKVLLIDIREGEPTRVAKVTFRGDALPYEAKVRAALKVGESDILDRARLARGVAAASAYLRRAGYLEADLAEPLVTITRARAAITILAHVGPHYTLRVRGNEPVAHAEVVETLNVSVSPLTRADVSGDLAERVRDLYARRGMPEAQVEVRRLRGRRRNSAVLDVAIRPGKVLTVVNIEFPGAYLLDQDQLRDQVYSYLEEDLPDTGLLQPVDAEVADMVTEGERGQERRVMRPLPKDPRTTYYASTYEAAIEHIVNLGHAQGFLSIKVGPARLRRLARNRAVVEIPVDEGPRTRLHDVRVAGSEVLLSRDLLVASGLTRSQPFSFVALEEARLRIVDAYQERGYFFARVEPQVRFSNDRTRADVRLFVVERFPVRVGRVVIRGAERTDEDYIREVIRMGQGDLYRPSLARESEQALQNLGAFSALSVRLQEPELPARVKTLIVEVTERRTQFLDVTAGVSSGQGVRGGFEYGYRNLFGQAVELSLRVQLAHPFFFVDDEVQRNFRSLTSLDQRIERRISLGISIPRTPLLEDVRTALDLVHLRNNERDFGIDSNGVGVTFTMQPLRQVTISFGTDLENNFVQLFKEGGIEQYLEGNPNLELRLRRLLRVPDGDTTLASVRGTVSWDRRDSPFTPTRGTFLSGAVELARTLRSETGNTAGDRFSSRFFKFSLAASGYIPLAGGVVLAGQVRFGRILHFTDDSATYPNRAYFMGGVDTIRGYFQDAMVPQDLVDQMERDPELTLASVTRAGDAFALLRGELRFPLYGQIRGGLFVDMGNLWADASNIHPLRLRPSVGAGLRLATPVGPVALDYGILLVRRRWVQEPFGALNFSIGLF